MLQKFKRHKIFSSEGYIPIGIEESMPLEILKPTIVALTHLNALSS
jgi:hypothetical protein